MWRKSSKSNSASQCVEVRGDLAAVRDSKNPSGPTVAADLSRLLATVKSGRLDR